MGKGTKSAGVKGALVVDESLECGPRKRTTFDDKVAKAVSKVSREEGKRLSCWGRYCWANSRAISHGLTTMSPGPDQRITEMVSSILEIP